MKIYKQTGSKERLFEMMERVNKVSIKEFVGNSTQNLNSNNVLDVAYNELVSKKLDIKQSNTQSVNDDTYVELLCLDTQGNNITFTFKTSASEGEQDGVYNVNDVILTSFSFDDATTGEVIDLDENDLRMFNQQHGKELFNVIEDYVDYEEPQPEIDEEYINAIKKIDSYPFGGGKHDMQTSKAYADEKPTNSKLRVKSPELDKYVDETTNIAPNPESVPQVGMDRQISKIEPHKKNYIIRIAVGNVREKLTKLGMSTDDITHDEFVEMIKNETRRLFTEFLTTGNDAGTLGSSGLNENDEYPDPLGTKFKAKTKYPKPKKKPTSTISVGENVEPTTPQEHAFKKKYGADWKKKRQEYLDRNKLTDDDWKELDDFSDSVQENDDSSSINVENEPKNDFGSVVIGNDPEKYQDNLEGGLADDKTPADFDPEQILMGVKVELEHTNDPMIAMEIALDHLTEIPDYYTRLNKMEDDANAEENGSEESDKSEKEMEDVLLGYEPKNVGDNMDETKEEITSPEGYEFLNKIKQEKPNEHIRFRNLVLNKGLNYAITKYNSLYNKNQSNVEEKTPLKNQTNYIKRFVSKLDDKFKNNILFRSNAMGVDGAFYFTLGEYMSKLGYNFDEDNEDEQEMIASLIIQKFPELEF